MGKGFLLHIFFIFNIFSSNLFADDEIDYFVIPLPIKTPIPDEKTMDNDLKRMQKRRKSREPKQKSIDWFKKIEDEKLSEESQKPKNYK